MGTQKHILLVEDNLISQKVALAQLKAIGCEVQTANNGSEALSKLASSSFDLILMDIQMPVMDGLTATRAIRTLPSPIAEIPIIAMTASDAQEGIDAARLAGMNAFIVKPVLRELLQEQLAHWLPGGGAFDVSQPTTGLVLRHENQPLFEVSGLDAHAALKSLHQDLPLYLHLIELFLTHHADDGRTLSEQIEHDQFSLARQQAHSLRGAAGNLGMTVIQQLATAIESAMLQKPGPHSALADVEKLTAELQRMECVLRPLLPSEVEPTADSAIDWRQVDAILQRLEPLLASNDTESQHLFLQSRNLLIQALGDEARSLARQLDDFDFEAALHTLHRFRERMPSEKQP